MKGFSYIERALTMTVSNSWIEEQDQTIEKMARYICDLNLYKELDPDDDELTRTRKLRRAFVEKRYEEIVAALYSENDSVHIDTTIKYEDGREARIMTDMQIRTVRD